jgi:hypothetical protein
MNTRSRSAAKDLANLRALDTARGQVECALASARSVKVSIGARTPMDSALERLVSAMRMLDAVKAIQESTD